MDLKEAGIHPDQRLIVRSGDIIPEERTPVLNGTNAEEEARQSTLIAFVAYAPTSDYDYEEVEAFYVELEKFYKEDHTSYKVMVGPFSKTRELEKFYKEDHTSYKVMVGPFSKTRSGTKLPLCPTFIDLKKAFDSVEAEAVVETLLTHGVPSQYISLSRAVQWVQISPFYNDVIINTPAGRELSPTGFRVMLREHKMPTKALIGLLRESRE
ncbi:unnamed protein product [Heligmosomoides polygyrus]|uniref:Reverse transcriptase domain-containing protein n=1 Tax=Heligmosomoides polygyrus TaxID=6339 RepID=A0A183FWV3_HELPZ|nr:unnamed protein product [Heligmosomoides polygyrus]